MSGARGFRCDLSYGRRNRPCKKTFQLQKAAFIRKELASDKVLRRAPRAMRLEGPMPHGVAAHHEEKDLTMPGEEGWRGERGGEVAAGAGRDRAGEESGGRDV
eukprot:960007-Pleurochrysis_carterae.AAC.1